MLTDADIANLERFLASALEERRGLHIENLARVHGGASRETYAFDAVFAQNGAAQTRGFILRRDPPGKFFVTDRALEFAAYNSVLGYGVPIPRPLAFVIDPKLIGAPFIIMERIDGGRDANPFNADTLKPHEAAIGRDFFAILGRIAAIDPHASPLAKIAMAPPREECWRRELENWAAIIAHDALEPQPIAWAAIRRLRANPPPPPRKLAIVHGDYRIGNFLHDGAGAITAILDWEMAHIGDPIEDLAWAMNPLWSLGRPERAAGLMPVNDAIELWEDNADQDFDAERFRWWSLFSSVKGVAIWLSSGRAYLERKDHDPVLAFANWYALTRHDQILAEHLAAAPRGLI